MGSRCWVSHACMVHSLLILRFFTCYRRFMHWAPFFLMGRMLFLHHYLPSYIFSVMATTTLVDFLFRDFPRPLFLIPRGTRMRAWRGSVTVWYVCSVFVIVVVVVYGFMYFSPLTYGLGFPDKATLRARKWITTWDLQYA